MEKVQNLIFIFTLKYDINKYKGRNTKMAKINEKELSKLFIEIKGNNKAAFEKLYNQYNKLVYNIAFSIVKNRQDTEDIVQIVFTKIYSIDKSKLPSKNEASWLYSTTKNETINFLKKKNNNINLEDIYEIEDNNNEIARIIDKDSYNKLISGISDKEKEIISLKVLADLSFEEIAKILKTPTGTVKWRYYKAVHTLKILLSNLGMFIITAILSITTFKNRKKSHLTSQNETNATNNEQYREDVSEPPLNKEEAKKDENSFLENSNSQTQENIIETPNTINNTNYIGLSFIGISTIFFIITITFLIIFTKHQLKRRKKLSK